MNIGNNILENKPETYLSVFQMTLRKLQGKQNMQLKDTPYEEKYLDRESDRQKKLLQEYVEYTEKQDYDIYRMLADNGLLNMIENYDDLSSGDRVRLYKSILKLYRQ